MEEVDELIKHFGLEENSEFVIIPFTDKSGKQKKRYLLKRRFIRIVYAEGYFIDYPLPDVIKATIKYPELLLSEALYLMYKESGAGRDNIGGINGDVENGNQSSEISERDSQ
jgi:hypothetical protein